MTQFHGKGQKKKGSLTKSPGGCRKVWGASFWNWYGFWGAHTGGGVGLKSTELVGGGGV